MFKQPAESKAPLYVMAAFIVLLAGILLLILLRSGNPSAPISNERIVSLLSEVILDRQGDLFVTETFKVVAERKEIKRGIYRQFVKEYTKSDGTKAALEYEVVRATLDGMPLTYKTDVTKSGQRIGLLRDGDGLNPGTYEFILQYRVKNHIDTSGPRDQLDWPVTGIWIFPIESAGLVVKLPALVDPKTIGAKATIKRVFVKQGESADGASEDAVKIELAPSEPKLKVWTTRAQAPGESFNVEVSWPRGFVSGQQ